MRDHNRNGWMMPLEGGRCHGQRLRMTEPFDQEIAMPGETYRLVRNYPGSKYEYTYVEQEHLKGAAT